MAGLALLIAVAGVYSPASRAITQREHEPGVRLALGATSEQIRRMILRQCTVPVAFGLMAAMAGPIGCAFIVRHLFVGMNGADGMALIMPSLFVILVAIGAAWSPTTRVLTIDRSKS